MNSLMPRFRIVIPVGVKGSVVGIEVVVSVQHQVGSMLVEDIPKGLRGYAPRSVMLLAALYERLVPVGECARGRILRQIVFQPCEFGG